MACDLCRVGQVLRSIREERGLTLDEVSDVLFIEKRFIEGIEAGDWGSLPEPFFVKGYVNQYAAFLDIADQFQTEVMSRKNGRGGPKGRPETISALEAIMMGLPGFSERSASPEPV